MAPSAASDGSSFSFRPSRSMRCLNCSRIGSFVAASPAACLPPFFFFFLLSFFLAFSPVASSSGSVAPALGTAFAASAGSASESSSDTILSHLL